MRLAPLAFLAACTVMSEGPASQGSASATSAASAAALADRAAAIEALAHELEVQVDEGRRRMEGGQSTQEEEAARVRELVAKIEAEDAAFQEAFKAWEAEIARASGLVPPPPQGEPPPPAAPPPPPGGSPPIQVSGEGR